MSSTLAALASEWVPRLPLAQRWLRRLNTSGPWGECHCAGFGPLADVDVGRLGILGAKGTPMWDYIASMDAFASSLHASTLTYFAGKRAFLAGHGLLGYTMSHLRNAIHDCIPGTAAVLVMALDLVEEILGMQAVSAIFAMLLALVIHSWRYPCHLEFAAVSESFTGNLFMPHFLQLPLLLGLGHEEGPVLRCARGAPRIFVYDVDERWTSPLLGCCGGLAATEVWVHRQLLQSDCRAQSAEEAELLFVPIYARCMFSREHQLFEKGYSWEHPFTNATRWYRELLSELAHFRTRPQDHVFVFPEEHWPVPEASFAAGGPFGRSLILSPEARPLSCVGRVQDVAAHGRFCKHLPPRAKGLVVIPSFVDGWRTSHLRAHNLPVAERGVLACFMGLGVSKAYSLTENHRGLLQVLATVPGFLIGDYDERYREIMGSSVFCLVPKGVGTWSHRLYEAMLAGCIPVILSNEVRLPFPELPWASFSVKWPMRLVDNETLPCRLRGLLNSGAVIDMKRAVDQYACWFDYHSAAEGCSPLVGLTRQLRQRGADPGPLGFWGTGGFPAPGAVPPVPRAGAAGL